MISLAYKVLVIVAVLGTRYADTSSNPGPPPPLSLLYLHKLIVADDSIYQILLKILLDRSFDSKSGALKQHLKSYLEDYNGNLIAEDDNRISKISGNPILVFRLLFRHVVDLTLIENDLIELGTSNALQTLQIIQETSLNQVKPNSETMDGAAQRLFRILEVYSLDIHNVVNGVFQSHSTGFRLDRRHCLYLSQQASNQGFHALAVEWAEVAREMATAVNDTVSINQATKILKQVATVHDSMLAAGERVDASDLKFPHKKHKSSRVSYNESPNHKMAEKRPRYYGTCSEENYQTEEARAQLNCWFENQMHEMWFINPLNVELLSANPLLLQVYDIINVADAKEIITTAEPILENSRVVDYDGENYSPKLAPYRTSFNTFLSPSTCSPCSKLYTKVERFTRLRTNSRGTEALQVASYTFGGHYLPHYDAVLNYTSDGLPDGVKENRVATFMIYLGNVDTGGFTAFPNLGVGVRPIFGSGVFWYNLNEEEDRYEEMVHAACPVILGGPKWVGTIWIRLREQFLNLPCLPK